MNTEVILVGLALVTLNIIGFKFIMSKLESKNIELVKHSTTGEKIREVVETWIQKVKIEYLPDGRIKLCFSSNTFSIVFFIQEMNHKIILSDHGEFVKDVDLNRTANKSLVDKLCHSSGLRWNGKQLYMESSLEMLDEDIWNMFSCMVTIQNVCY